MDGFEDKTHFKFSIMRPGIILQLLQYKTWSYYKEIRVPYFQGWPQID